MAVYTDISLTSASSKILAKDLEVAHQAIIAILNTKKGERLFRPNVGNTLEDNLFDLVDDATALDITRKIVSDINSQITTVSVNKSETKVTPVPLEGKFNLTLVVDLLGLNEGRLVFTGELSNLKKV